uniref:HNH nuclease domain-containing protein n=1 Tax=uncultured bacterium A1Q1_fos_2004 TaxID=1256557 RepID=L7VY25_9BACT|nr:hypothetical protein [uncultured bacterium A1Q1_fos_2004]
MGVEYYQYIQSEEWRQRANEAKRRAGYRCRVCNRSSKEVVLNAHHRTYKRLGHEDPDDITVLCRDCHELYELNKKLPRLPHQEYQPTTYQTISTTQSYKAASEKLVLSPSPVSNLGSSEASLKTMALTFVWVLLAISLITSLIVYFGPTQEADDSIHTPSPSPTDKLQAGVVVAPTSTLSQILPIPTKRPPMPTPEPIITVADCTGGCTEYPDWCSPPIKGNVNYNTRVKIYHMPGQEYYDDTKINVAYGERWFCTEQEAQAAGWRKSRR